MTRVQHGKQPVQHNVQAALSRRIVSRHQGPLSRKSPTPMQAHCASKQ